MADEPIPLPSKKRNWRAGIAADAKGRVIPSAANALYLLTRDPELVHTFAHNAFTRRNILTQAVPAAISNLAPQPGPYPRTWTDNDCFLVQAYLHRFYTEHFNYSTVERAMAAAAATTTFHPILQWLDSIKWDGVYRIDTWMVEAFGADNDAYTRAVSAKFLIAAARRVRSPGCQFDHMPLLGGAQGIGKSRCCRSLFGDEWFTDDLPHDLANKDSPHALLGVWGIELAEVAQLLGNRNGLETVKSFLARRIDRFRPPYGRSFIEQPRQAVFIGTTNRDDIFRDETGNRRFWPIQCAKADFEWIAEFRSQLWAEAAAREATGECIWLDNEELQSEAIHQQAIRFDEDVWTPRVRDIIAAKLSTTSTQLLSDLGVPIHQQDNSAKTRIARILKMEHWWQKISWNAALKKTERTWMPPS